MTRLLHRPRHAARRRPRHGAIDSTADRWPFWGTLSLCIGVFLMAFAIATAVQLQTDGYARPAPTASTSQTGE